MKAFRLVQKVTDEEPWKEIAQRRTEDLLVYLALPTFRRRRAIAKLPLTIQRDIRAFLGTYAAVCEKADELLFLAGNAKAVDMACPTQCPKVFKVETAASCSCCGHDGSFIPESKDCSVHHTVRLTRYAW